MVAKRARDDDPSASELASPVQKRIKKSVSLPCSAAAHQPPQSLAPVSSLSPNSGITCAVPLPSDHPPPEHSALLPITRKNLERLARETGTHGPSNMSASPSKESASERKSNSSTPNVADNLAKLSAYGIRVCQKATKPADVEALVESFEKEDQGRGKNTPEKVRDVYQQAYYSKIEAEGIAYLSKHLLPLGQIASKKKGIPLITTKPELNFKESWVPITDSRIIKTGLGPLLRPRPDHCVGYVSSSDAERVSVDAPFTSEEEALLNRTRLADQIHFPFFTAQWKAQGSSESHIHARVQGARDGASIVNHLTHFFDSAGHDAGSADTCHFSMTCDMDSVQVYVHWREISSNGVERFHMELIKRTWLDEEDQVKDYKRYLQNIVHWAVTIRLGNIQRALTKLRFVKASNMRSLSSSPPKLPCSIISSSSSSQLQPAPTLGPGTLPTFDQPTPPSSIDVVSKKRKIDGDG